MRKVWKFVIPVMDEEVRVDLPLGARIVHVAATHDPHSVMMWAEVHPHADTAVRWFRVFGTGHPIPDRHGVMLWEHKGTAIWNSGELVWHLYERVHP